MFRKIILKEVMPNRFLVYSGFYESEFTPGWPTFCNAIFGAQILRCDNTVNAALDLIKRKEPDAKLFVVEL